MSRYDPLTTHLRAQSAARVRMSFAEIEKVLGRKLPGSAATQRAFWSNNASNNVMTRAWLAAGFRTEQVDQGEQTLVFRRLDDLPAASSIQGNQAPFNLAFDNKLALFGWMKGTITIAPDVDLTESADAEAELVDEGDEPAA